MNKVPNILLVEDEDIVTMVVSKLLETLGCRVDTAVSGAEALAKVSKGYDLIFMDIGLPDMSGIAIAVEIRCSEQGESPTPIIAFTAYTDSTLARNCLDAGMNAVLYKPASLESLKEIVARYTG